LLKLALGPKNHRSRDLRVKWYFGQSRLLRALNKIRCCATASMSASACYLKAAELNTSATVLFLTNLRSGPQNPESRSRNLCPLDWHWQQCPPASLRVPLIMLAAFFISRRDTPVSPKINLLPSPCLFFHLLTFIPFHSSFLLFVNVLYTYCIYCSASCYGGIAIATITACCTKLLKFDILCY
jgi:hypothetical protein